METKTISIRGVPEQLRRKLTAAAATRGMTMEKYIVWQWEKQEAKS